MVRTRSPRMNLYKNWNSNVEISNGLSMLESTRTSLLDSSDQRVPFSRYTNDPETGARELASLLSDQIIFTGVHPGDLFGTLIEHFGRQQKYKQVKLRIHI